MKRTAIIISLILGLSHIGFAQRDTIGAGHPFYFPTPLNFDSLQHDCILNYDWICKGIYLQGGGEDENVHADFDKPNNYIDFIAIKDVPDTDIHIIGIAYGFYYRQVVTSFTGNDMSRQVVKLYIKEGEDLVPLDSVSETVVIDSTLIDHLIDHDFTGAFSDSTLLKYYDLGQSFRDWMMSHGLYAGETGYEVKDWGIKESYFQNEITLSQGDTFYITSIWRIANTIDSIDGRVVGNAFIAQPRLSHTLTDTIPFFLPPFEYRMMDTNDVWYDDQAEGIVPLVWAIIRRDCDSCPRVRELQHFKASANKAFFRWQRGTNHHDWQLSYGPVGTAPEDGTIVDYTVPQSGLITLDPDSHYVVYVRARCKFARYEYGPWSAPYTFSINGGNGIEEVSPNEVTLTPNPAADHVTVAAEGMERMELIGVDGTVLLRRDCRGECQIDLTGLAAGLYMVHVATATGTTTKRLVVAR